MPWSFHCTVGGMKSKFRTLGFAALAAGATFALVNCDNSNTDPNPPPASNPGIGPSLGGYSMDCGGAGSQQQQQSVPFQQQQSCVSEKQASGQSVQSYSFPDSKVDDFSVQLDCSAKMVTVKSLGRDDAFGYLPIQDDGSVSGDVTFQQRVASDGLGNDNCWVGYVVAFTGKANCHDGSTSYGDRSEDRSRSEEHAATDADASGSTGHELNGRAEFRMNASGGPVHSSEARGGSSESLSSSADSLQLTTSIAFQKSSNYALESAGISLEEAAAPPTGTNAPNPAPSIPGGPATTPSASIPSAAPTEEPIPSAAPSDQSPGGLPPPDDQNPPGRPTEPAPGPSALPSPSPSPSPRPSPSASPSAMPTAPASEGPIALPTAGPTGRPGGGSPNESPTTSPNDRPTAPPSDGPADLPTSSPTDDPTALPSAGVSTTPGLPPPEHHTPHWPIPFPTHTPRPRPTPSPSDSPSPVPTQTTVLVPVVFCEVTAACPIEGNADLSCSQQ